MSGVSKHTPGPWKVGYRSIDVGCENPSIGGYAKLFDVRGWGYLTGTGHAGLGLNPDDAYEIQKANAQLVAAAPDLFSALKALLSACEEDCGVPSEYDEDDEAVGGGLNEDGSPNPMALKFGHLRAAAKAIAKAGGCVQS